MVGAAAALGTVGFIMLVWKKHFELNKGNTYQIRILFYKWNKIIY